MPEEPTGGRSVPREGWVASIAVAVAVLAVFLPWTSVGSASLDGTQGPNNGWLVAIVGIFALGLTRLMVRGSWVGVVGVLGASIVMFWTAVENWLDNRDVLEGAAGLGLVLVLAAAVVLAASPPCGACTWPATMPGGRQPPRERSQHARVDARVLNEIPVDEVGSDSGAGPKVELQYVPEARTPGMHTI